MPSDKYTYHRLIQDTLRQVNKPLSAEEIWVNAVELGLDRRLRGQPGKTPHATIAAQIYVSLKRDDTPFVKVGRRPVRFFLRNLLDKISPKQLEREADRPEDAPRPTLKERDIHPLLVYFARTQLGVYARTIGHQQSSKSKKSEWLHPDLVGLSLPADTWEPETLSLSREIGATVAQLFAFELKRRIDFSNLRESFFQAVSNSSWANEGYLVAADFSADGEFQSELKRLSDAFGIGVIQLDVTDPDASQVLYRSRKRIDLDWETINKLAGLNPDFREFMHVVQDSLKIHRINPADFDGFVEDPDVLVSRYAKMLRA